MRRALLASMVLLAAGCQLVAGFKDFEVDEANESGCEAGARRCAGAELQRCRADGSGYELVEACASEALCNTGKEAGACTPPACGKGSKDATTGGELPQNRCEGGQVAVCASDQQQYVTTDCAPKQCDPAGGRCIELKIDATEVTVGAYKKFLTDKPTVDTPAACKGNDRQPDAACMGLSSVCKSAGAGCDGVPQVCVDWCDAYEFCKSAGKRLCGLLDQAGAMAPMAGFSDAGQSEWMNACSAGGENAWVVGKAWDDLEQGQLCNGGVKARNAATADVFPAGELTACASPVGAYKNVYDMAGNVAEWENSCERAVESPEASKEDNCRVRGGSFGSEKPKLRCDADRTEKRGEGKPDVGFRCCG